MKVEPLMDIAFEEYHKSGISDYFIDNYSEMIAEIFGFIYPLKAIMSVLHEIDVDCVSLFSKEDVDIKDLDSIDCDKLICNFYTQIWQRKGDKEFGLIRSLSSRAMSKNLIDMTVGHVVFIEALNDASLYTALLDKYGDEKDYPKMMTEIESTAFKLCCSCLFKKEENDSKAVMKAFSFLYSFSIELAEKMLKDS